ncbi:MAG: manganese efflux pump MntP family protein [Patescibacteria group bacterium]|jgi:putative Mn2+ efflux pump MntP
MLITDLILALSLAVDAFVVSLALGVKHKHLSKINAGLIALNFGVFQAIMPWLGWKTTVLFYEQIIMVDHWIAFILLALLGINMIRTVLNSAEAQPNVKISLKSILLLGVATSIDALAVGFTLPTISSQPLITITIIGGVTGLVCYLAFIGTRWIPKSISKPAELGAGLVLIGLGCKILLSHLFG